MATFVIKPQTVKVPIYLKAFELKPDHKDEYIKSLDYLHNKYGSVIEKIARQVGIDKRWIYTFQLIEAPKHVFKNPETVVSRAGAVGLMQITPATANDQIILYKKKWGNVPAILFEELKKIGKDKLLTLDTLGAWQGKSYALTKEDLKNPVLNLVIGAMMLKNLFDYFGNRLDLIVHAYNFSPVFSEKQAQKRLEKYPTVEDTINKSPRETQVYITKLMGGDNNVIKFVQDYFTTV